jgi:hypothetical protein
VQAFEAFGSNPSRVTDLDLPLRSFYKLAAPSTPESARVEVLNRADSGERFKHAQIQAIITQHGEQLIHAAASEIRARKLEEHRDRAKAAAAVEAGGFVGGTVADLERLAAKGFRASAILADCPWRFVTWSHVGLADDRGQANRGQRSLAPPYKTMTLEEIRAALSFFSIARWSRKASAATKMCASTRSAVRWVDRPHVDDVLEVGEAAFDV